MKTCCKKGTKEFNDIAISSDVLKAISEPNRLKILCILYKKDICVCKMAKELDVSRNLVSFHLRKLYEVGILDKKREGNQIFFFIKKSWEKRLQNLFSFLGIK